MTPFRILREGGGHQRQHAHYRPSWPKWVLLVATIALMASMACDVSVEEGIKYVEFSEEAGLIAADQIYSDSIQAGLYGELFFASPDGGLTWTSGRGQPEATGEFNLVVDTARGRYTLEGSDIVRTNLSNERVTVYSSTHLQQPGNMWFQWEDTAKLGDRAPALEPLSIAHDPTTGNVVATMGIQGVVVGTPDEQWRRVAVGPYTPTDFSFASKSMKLLTHLPFWLASIALTLSMLALSLVSSQLSKRRLLIFLLTLISSLLGISLLILMAIRVQSFSVSAFWILLAFVGTLIILAVMQTALKPSSNLPRLIAAALLWVPCVGLATVTILASSEPGGVLGVIIFSPIVYVLVGLMLLVSGQDLVGYGTISRFLVATNGLVLLSFMVWLHSGIETWAVTVLAVTLAAGAAFIYTAYLRSRNRPDDDPFVDGGPKLVLRTDSAPSH